MADIFAYKKEMFVFIDETGADSRDYIRRFGYAIQGEAPVYHRWLARGKRISAIAAISCDGLLECELVTGTVNGEVFLEFVRGNLIPQMLPFDGINNKSIAILDNCSVHHIREVAEEFRKAGILAIFLPPYSPDYMPIELCFSYIKYYLKSHDDILQDPKVVIQSAFNSVTKDQCNNWITICK